MTLRVRVSIVPHGDETKEQEIEVLNISNIGKKLDPDFCTYVIEHNQYKQVDDYTPLTVHKRSEGALVLIRKALQELGY